MQETFAQILRRVRSKSGLSLSEAARRAGMTKAHLWQLEDGRSDNPTAKTLKALADLYSVSACTLLRAAMKEKV